MIALGLDVGGTSTRAVLVDESGACLAVGGAGGGNWITSTPDACVTAVRSAVGAALAAAGSSAAAVAGWTLAMAGLPDGEQAGLGRALLGLGLGPPVFASDVLAAFCSGTWRADGYALVVGTGAVAARIEGGREAAIADGRGWLLGDDGSGFWIGQRVVRAALADLDGRGPATALTELVWSRAAADHPTLVGIDRRTVAGALAEALYRERPVALARFAPDAFAAARADDEVARGILERAAAALARTLATVLAGQALPVVISGGVAGRNPRLAQAIVDRLPSGATGEVQLVADGAAGAAALALRNVGVPVDAEVFGRIVATKGVSGAP